MVTTIEALRDVVVRAAPGEPLGLYLTGSYCDGGLRPDSDLDILLITRQSLQAAQRHGLVEHLLGYSGRRATRQSGRPVELISLVRDDIDPWRYPAVRDFLYGEWLRGDYERGLLPEREIDPNIPVIITSARQHSTVLWGPPVTELVDVVPRQDLARSMFDALPSLVSQVDGDERNVLLTLARMLHTVRTGHIVPKDVAALEASSLLEPVHARLLDLAARAYRGEVADDWSSRESEVAATVGALTDRIEEFRS